MKYYIVLDTNVLISSLLKKESNPGKVFDYIVKGLIIPIVCKEIISEYIEVLHRDKFSFNNNEIDYVIYSVIRNAIFVENLKYNYQLADSKDTIFYVLVKSIRHEYGAYLVTGNLKHFPNEKYIISVKQMIDIIENS